MLCDGGTGSLALTQEFPLLEESMVALMRNQRFGVPAASMNNSRNGHRSSTPSSGSGDLSPAGTPAGFVEFFRADFTAGFLVFLIALPLCLGIAVASGFPPIAGVFTAVVGGFVAPLISNSELTIKGPAAGLIVIVLGAMQALGYTGGGDPVADAEAYRRVLAVCFVAGGFQMAFGLLRAGVLGDFFPTAVVHGMLAAIGCMIVLKQLPVALGRSAAGEPLELVRHLPDVLARPNPAIALIGVISMLILFLLPLVKRRCSAAWIRGLPAQLVVLLVAVPLGIVMGLSEEHTYRFAGGDYPLGPSFLVNVPRRLSAAITTPDFSVFESPAMGKVAALWVVLLAVVGNLESLLSAKAIDLVDPHRRKTKADRDLVAIGVGNMIAASIGGLPMISEIVRSRASIDSGARTRFANFWHAVFLLAAVVLIPGLVCMIPLAALAAMLVYTGCRLASPAEFLHVYRIGREQLLIFLATLLGVLATDLLVGVAIGVAVKLAVHMANGLPLKTMFMPFLDVVSIDESTVRIDARGSAVFSNWIPFRRQLRRFGLENGRNVILNLEGARLVDHSAMEGLEQLQEEFDRAGLVLEVTGLEDHLPLSKHPLATRKRRKAP